MARGSLRERVVLATRALREGFDLGPQIDQDEDLFRRVTDNGRDLSPLTQERAREVSHYLWEKNPMGKRIIELIVDFVVGEGMVPTAPDEKVKAWIDELWQDPMLGLELRFHDFTRDQSLNGEAVYRMFTNDQTGRTRIGYIDPRRISRIVKHPEDMLIDQFLFLKGPNGEEPKPLELVWFDDSEEGEPGKWVGDTFYFPINRPLTATRGRPDLLTLADWVDGYDQMLWNIIDRSGLQNAFVWDVTLTGSTDTEIANWLTKYGTAPRPGTVRAHNDKEDWDAVTPQLGGTGFTENARMIKNHALGGAGIPEAWYADGDSANRATLQSQSDPTYRMLSRRQSLVKWQWESIFRYHIQAGINSGQLPRNVDTTVDVQMADPSEQDVTGVAAVLPQLVNALMGAMSDELVSSSTARKMFATVAGMLGVDIDPEEEETLIGEEAVVREKEEGDMRAQEEQRQRDLMELQRKQSAVTSNRTTDSPDDDLDVSDGE